MDFHDATGAIVSLAAPPRRIVSLIPSITEILFAVGAGDAVAGCTVYCTQPPEGVATKTRVGGEKDPKLEVIRDLDADLVIANVEENLREHVETLRGWGIPVYVTYPHTVADGIRLVRDLGELVGQGERAGRLAGELAAAREAVRKSGADTPRRRVFYPIWRRPWMTVNRDTYAHDMLAECGGINVFGGHERRAPGGRVVEGGRGAPAGILVPGEAHWVPGVDPGEFPADPQSPGLRGGRADL